MTTTTIENTMIEEEVAKQRYELLYIVPMKFSIEELESIYQKVRDIVQEHQGVITHEELFRKQKLAYRMRHINYGYVTHGYYILVEMDTFPRSLPLIKHDLKLTTEVLRSMIIKTEILTEEDQKRQTLLKEKLAQKEEATRAQISKPAILDAETKKVSFAPPALPTTQGEEQQPIQGAMEQNKDKGKIAEEEPQRDKEKEEKPRKPEKSAESSHEKTKKAAKPQKLSLEELDKKLDEILDKDTFI